MAVRRRSERADCWRVGSRRSSSSVAPPERASTRAMPHRSTSHRSASTVLNVLGAGDAFASGLLFGLRRGWPLARAVRLGNATGAIVVTRHGCANFMPTWPEVEEFVAAHGGWAVRTRRLTVAQAVVEFLVAQQSERDGRTAPVLRGCVRHFRPRQRRRRRRSAACGPRSPALLSAAQRAGDGAHGGGVREDGQPAADVRLHDIDRTGRDEHGHRALPVRPSTGCRSCCCPATSSPRGVHRAGAAAARIALRLRISRSTTASSRCRGYWDRINRPEQLAPSLPEAMRVLTSPADTGAVTLAPAAGCAGRSVRLSRRAVSRRVSGTSRAREPMRRASTRAAALLTIRDAAAHRRGRRRDLQRRVARRFAALPSAPASPSAKRKPGKARWHSTIRRRSARLASPGRPAANRLARDADVVIVVGSRLSDFTTASKTAFQNPGRQVHRHERRRDSTRTSSTRCRWSAMRGVRSRISNSASQATAYRTPTRGRVAQPRRPSGKREADRLFAGAGASTLSQAEVIGALNAALGPRDVVVCAAGSLPGDLHKLWRARDPKGYHLEYGYSCMGYEIAGGLGVKMAAPDREVVVLVGDGSYLMMAQETRRRRCKRASRSRSSCSTTTGSPASAVCRNRWDAPGSAPSTAAGPRAALDGEPIAVDFAANAASLGAHVIEARDRASLPGALRDALASPVTSVVVVPVDRNAASRRLRHVVGRARGRDIDARRGPRRESRLRPRSKRQRQIF